MRGIISTKEKVKEFIFSYAGAIAIGFLALPIAVVIYLAFYFIFKT